MKILVVGNGGREHALAWCLAQSARVNTVFVAPGNAGTATTPKLENVDYQHVSQLISFCRQQAIDFTVVGPEAPLAAGIVDDFRAAGLAIFGPDRYCAQLESSKDFAKQFMRQHNIPTAAATTFDDAAAAHDYIQQHSLPVVIKADGLAAGKGVVVAQTHQEAHQAIDDMLLDQQLGQAGARVVIEDFLVGEEASFIVMVDGQHVLPLATSQDHKRLLDHDQGPNTGGMGAYSPAPVVTPAVHQRVLEQIILPAVRGMQASGHPYTGFLYAGLMIDDQGQPYTIEFNCRLGDPETQAILSRLDSDLAGLIQAALAGRLDQVAAQWQPQTAVAVVLAAKGYPQAVQSGDPIQGLDAARQQAHVFQAATLLNQQGQTITNGGRVLSVVGLGNDVASARQQAYQALENIRFAGMQYRQDIGHKALSAEVADKAATTDKA
ncbi:phosphoribosylamine--glycine ligase [Neisseriaceae bacterium ESL0693]|nr:phosphoribosylamine--glycine ligase [Neisseriaceae bacterium ESL0693]